MTSLVRETNLLTDWEKLEEFNRFLRINSGLIKDGRAKEVLAILHTNSLRLTLTRLVIIETICKIDHEFDIARLIKEVAFCHPEIGNATIYRNVKLLTQLDILIRVNSWPGNACYLLNLQHQHWATCRNCGQKIKFDKCQLEEAIGKFVISSGFRVETHYLELVGLCQACQSNFEANNFKP